VVSGTVFISHKPFLSPDQQCQSTKGKTKISRLVQ